MIDRLGELNRVFGKTMENVFRFVVNKKQELLALTQHIKIGKTIENVDKLG